MGSIGDVENIGDDIDDVVEEEDITSIPPEQVVDQNVFGIGKIFKSIEDAHDAYQEYASKNGFSIRRRSTLKSTCGPTVTGVVFCCSCEGNYKIKKTSTVVSEDSVKITRSGSTMRSGCNARMRIRRLKDSDSWVISVLEDKHSHTLVTPSKRILMKSRRRMPAAAKALTESFRRENIQLSKIPALFGGSSNVPFDKRDVWNHARYVRSLNYEEGDAEGVKNYFKQRAAENPHFFYVIQCDGVGRATNFFWVDSRSRMAYSRFGDAVTFDTTYMTNKYSMPFAPFTGVNHHRQSILFGCALLENEVEDTFIWLFETWLEAMGGKPPISIITDQDAAMKRAIAKVFPTSRHRFCLWHIKMKFVEKLSHVFFKKSKFKQAVKRCTRGARSIKEFEEQWSAMLRDYDLEGNDWLRGLYAIRESWIPVYCMNTFFAGMNTTQRSESINSFFDGFVTAKTNLREFARKYDQAMEDIYVSERKEDYISIYKTRILKSKELILAHAANTYTRNMFAKLSAEFDDLYLFAVDETGVDGDVHTYRVRYRIGSDEQWTITFNLSAKEGSCQCQLYEFLGLPCKHLMKVFDRLNYNEFPSYFIMKRWVKGANRVKVTALDGWTMQDSHIGSVAARTSDLSRRAIHLALLAGESELGYKEFSEILDKAHDRIEQINDSLLEKENNSTMCTEANAIKPFVSSSKVEGIVLLDPHISQTKGRKRTIQGNEKEAGSSNLRLKSGLELATQPIKPRICRGCNGSGHDSRNCPKKNKVNNSLEGCGSQITKLD